MLTASQRSSWRCECQGFAMAWSPLWPASEQSRTVTGLDNSGCDAVPAWDGQRTLCLTTAQVCVCLCLHLRGIVSFPLESSSPHSGTPVPGLAVVPDAVLISSGGPSGKDSSINPTAV